MSFLFRSNKKPDKRVVEVEARFLSANRNKLTAKIQPCGWGNTIDATLFSDVYGKTVLEHQRALLMFDGMFESFLLSVSLVMEGDKVVGAVITGFAKNSECN